MGGIFQLNDFKGGWAAVNDVIMGVTNEILKVETEYRKRLNCYEVRN